MSGWCPGKDLTVCPSGAPLAEGSVESEYCVFATQMGNCSRRQVRRDKNEKYRHRQKRNEKKNAVRSHFIFGGDTLVLTGVVYKNTRQRASARKKYIRVSACTNRNSVDR